MNSAKILTIILSLLAALFAQTVYSADTPNFPARKAMGVVVSNAGMTLYTFDKDSAGNGKSACNDACAAIWPPFSAEGAANAGPFTVITRDNGSKQWALKGKPLYLYAKDANPGDMNGDNINNVWHIIVE